MRAPLAVRGNRDAPPAPPELLGLPDQRVQVADEWNGGEESVRQ
jgi:hypothetical protein